MKSGEKGKIILRLRKQGTPGCDDSLSVLFFETADDKYDNILRSINIESNNLIIDSTSSPDFPRKWLIKNISGKLYTIPRENNGEEFLITVEVEAPTVDFPKMMFYPVNTYTACGGGSFHLPIIVLPN